MDSFEISFFFGQVVTQQEENEGRQLDKLPSAR